MEPVFADRGMKQELYSGEMKRIYGSYRKEQE